MKRPPAKTSQRVRTSQPTPQPAKPFQLSKEGFTVEFHSRLNPVMQFFEVAMALAKEGKFKEAIEVAAKIEGAAAKAQEMNAVLPEA